MMKVGSRIGSFVYKMANEHYFSSFPMPVSVCCSPDVRLSSERTVTSKRTRIHDCLELSDNLHFSIAGNCMRAMGTWTEHLSRASVLLPLMHSASVLLQNSSSALAMIERMPRLKHMMRCRRGSTRRQIRCSPTSSNTPIAVSPTSESTSRATRG